MAETLKAFAYRFDAGPLPLDALDDAVVEYGNCRLAVQDYFACAHGRYVPPEDILCPRSFLDTGTLVADFSDAHGPERFFRALRRSDIVFAERIRDVRGDPVDASVGTFPTEEGYLVRLHTAVWLGRVDIDASDFLPPEWRATVDPDREYVWHSTVAAGGTALWSLEKFLEYYRPVRARRFVSDRPE